VHCPLLGARRHAQRLPQADQHILQLLQLSLALSLRAFAWLTLVVVVVVMLVFK
jgi:hypothetical protein